MQKYIPRYSPAEAEPAEAEPELGHPSKPRVRTASRESEGVQPCSKVPACCNMPSTDQEQSCNASPEGRDADACPPAGVSDGPVGGGGDGGTERECEEEMWVRELEEEEERQAACASWVVSAGYVGERASACCVSTPCV